MSKFIKTGADLDWEAARTAATGILKQCNDAGFVAPEAADIHQIKVARICGYLGDLVDALKISKREP